MESKAVLSLILMLLLTCALASVVTIQPAKTNETATAQIQQEVGILSEVGPPIEWYKTYGGADLDWAWSMVRTSDGGYALAGRTKSFGAGGIDDFWLVKTDGDGNMQWSRTYGGTGYDYAYSVVQTTDGGYAIAGTIEGSGSDYNFWLVKTDSLGNMQWNAVYGGSRSDDAYSVIQTSDGGYALAGETWISSSRCAFWLVKTDSSGNMQWSHTYGGAYEDYASSVIQTSDGGYAIVGTTWPSSTAYSDVWLVRTDSYGNVLWDKKYLGTGSANDYGYSVIQTNDGGYAIAGKTQVSGIPEYKCLLVKTDSNGNTQWIGKYAIALNDGAYSVIQTSDGGYALACYHMSESSYNSQLKKVYANGTEQWSVGPLAQTAIRSVVQTTDGGYALGGSTNLYGAGGYDFLLVKVAAEVQYTLTITTATGGTTNPSPGTYTYWAGTTVNVTATPNSGYIFDHWELDGAPAGSQNPISVTMNSDHTLHAVFQAKYDVTIKAHCNTEGVDISVGITMDGSPTGYNTPHTFTGLTGTHTFTVPSTDPSGHPFKQWNTGSTSTTITITGGGTYTAYYEAAVTYYFLTIFPSVGGTTNPSPGTYSYQAGTVVSVTAIPYTNYMFDHWELDGANPGSTNPISITMNTNHNLSAVFIYSPSPGVGGIVIPVDKFALLAPYIGLASTVIVATVATAIYAKRVKRRKEKQ
jgi:hypothetical protein